MFIKVDRIYKQPMVAVAKSLLPQKQRIGRIPPRCCDDCKWVVRNGVNGTVLLCENEEGLNTFVDADDYCSRGEK